MRVHFRGRFRRRHADVKSAQPPPEARAHGGLTRMEVSSHECTRGAPRNLRGIRRADSDSAAASAAVDLATIQPTARARRRATRASSRSPQARPAESSRPRRRASSRVRVWTRCSRLTGPLESPADPARCARLGALSCSTAVELPFWWYTNTPRWVFLRGLTHQPCSVTSLFSRVRSPSPCAERRPTLRLRPASPPPAPCRAADCSPPMCRLGHVRRPWSPTPDSRSAIHFLPSPLVIARPG
jgi:hypothetical protein